MSRVKIAGSAPVSRQTRSAILVTAIAVSGVFSDGFQIVASPQTAASAAFHDQTATGKLKARNHRDHAERMPLLHQAMVRPLRLNRQAVEHARLADGEIADVDHLLHFAFAFGDDFAGLERDELAEIVTSASRKRVAELADGFAAHRAGRDAPFLETLPARARSPCRNPPPRRCGHCASNLPSIGENFSMIGAAAAPFAAKDAVVFVGEAEFLRTVCIEIARSLSQLQAGIAR